MGRDDWRLRIELEDEHGSGLLQRLARWDDRARELAQDLKNRRLAVTRDDDTVFVYASTSLELEQARTLIEAELEELGAKAESIAVEHWLADEGRWNDDPAGSDVDGDLLAEGYAPWEVRIQAADHEAARRLAEQLESEGYGISQRWHFVIAGCATREQAEELAARVHGTVEAGGERVWETMPGNPFAVFFGGLADAGGPI
jgi:hypothetical protein